MFCHEYFLRVHCFSLIGMVLLDIHHLRYVAINPALPAGQLIGHINLLC